MPQRSGSAGEVQHTHRAYICLEANRVALINLLRRVLVRTLTQSLVA